MSTRKRMNNLKHRLSEIRGELRIISQVYKTTDKHTLSKLTELYTKLVKETKEIECEIRDTMKRLIDKDETTKEEAFIGQDCCNTFNTVVKECNDFNVIFTAYLS